MGEAVVVVAQEGELLTLKFTLHVDERLEAARAGEGWRGLARAGEAIELVRASQTGGGGDAVGLDEIAPSFAIFEHALGGQ